VIEISEYEAIMVEEKATLQRNMIGQTKMNFETNTLVEHHKNNIQYWKHQEQTKLHDDTMWQLLSLD